MTSDSEILATGRPYGVFLAHNSADKVLVQELAEQLQKRGVSSFLDTRDIRPGEHWQESLERGLKESRACAVCIGPAGPGPWTQEEIRVAINQSAQNSSFVVIPVLLPRAKSLDSYQVSAFLRQRHLVDFRSGFTDEGLELLAKAVLSAGSNDQIVVNATELQVPPAQERIGRVIEVRQSDTDQILEKLYSQEALSELARLRQIPHFPAKGREDIKSLTDRIQGGNLQHASPSVKAQVLQLAARRYATAETLDVAHNFREALRKMDPTASTLVIDSLLLKAEGDVDAALRSLRDVNGSDSHDVFFGILNETRGDALSVEWYESQEQRDDPDFFTGLGWCNLAVALAHLERWEDASAHLAHAAKHRDEYADFSYIEGVVNAALLLPSEYRRLSLVTNLFPPRSLEGADADLRRAHAIYCFKKAEEYFSIINPERAFAAKEWGFWLRLTHADPEERKRVITEIEEDLRARDLSQGIKLIPLARLFQVPFDSDRYWKHLDLRAKIGGLDDRELYARYELAQARMSPQEFFLFLDSEEARLTQLFPQETIAILKIEALTRGGQTAKARSQLDHYKNVINEDELRRISVILNAQEGKDPRVELEKLYENTLSLQDLQSLVNHLGKSKDWKALRPLQAELFRRERSIGNLLQLVACIERDSGGIDDEVLELLDSNSDLASRDLDLLAAKARALLHLGQVSEARALNDTLLRQRKHPADLDLDISLALQAGDWERFPEIVERESLRRGEHEARELIRLASLAAETEGTASRAFELLKLAAEKGSEDPHVLAQAAGLAYRLGREDEKPAAWLAKAATLSPEGGPVTTVALRELVEEWMPKHQESRRTAEELWLRGEAPLHLVANSLNTPLSILLIDLPQRNERTQDGRRRTIIPIMSGARQPITLWPEWTVGFDISSLMVLAHLGILHETLGSFRRVVIAPDTMVVLLNERNQVRFHQPSLVKKAEEIRRLIDRRILRIEDALPSPSEGLMQEVGRDLAQLLAAAQKNQGRVVRPRPVPKLRSFRNEEANLGENECFILSTVELEQLLYESGILDSATHERAAQYLNSQDQGTKRNSDASVLKGTLYLDDLALTYLQSAGLLPALEGSRLDLRLHPSVKDEQLALIESELERQRLEKNLEEIRVTLRNALQSGTVEFLRRHGSAEAAEENVIRMAPTLGEFMQDSESYDAVAIDDRFSQKFGKLADRSMKEKPVIGVIDILQHLETQGVIARERRYSLLHKLRLSGFALIPVEPEELASYVLAVQWREDEQVIETAELRVLRQSLARIRSIELLSPEESRFLGQLETASILVIRQIWVNETIAKERAVWMTDWIWNHVSPSLWGWVRRTQENDAQMQQAFVHHLFLLLMPLPIEKERLAAFLDWIQEAVLEPLRPENGEILERLVRQVEEQIKSWSKEIE